MYVFPGGVNEWNYKSVLVQKETAVGVLLKAVTHSAPVEAEVKRVVPKFRSRDHHHRDLTTFSFQSEEDGWTVMSNRKWCIFSVSL